MKKPLTLKLCWLMRLCTIQLLGILTLSGASIAHPNYAQQLDQKVTLSLNAVPFEQALAEIESATKLRFVYSIDQLGFQEVITVEAENKILRNMLEEIFQPRSIKYKFHEAEGSITLRKVKAKSNEDESNSQSSGHESVVSNIDRITGTVTDAATAEPIPGVTILLKGTNTGTTSDAEGRFTIGANIGDVLVFSYIGYTTQEIRISAQVIINISLEEESVKLNDVVINAGYWKVNDRERTGNISRITAVEIQRQPVNNPLQALQGRMPGVQVTQLSGLPGGGFTVRIRGTNSLRTDANEPLYIVDGVPFIAQTLSYAAASGGVLQNPSPLTAINPADIESIEVLKDADATAIYGSRGANGVILITTKKAQSGKTTFDANIWHGIGRVANRMSLLNSQQYLAMRREGMQNDGYWPLAPALQQFAHDVFMWDTTRFTDWQKELIGGKANITNAQFSLSAGNANTQFTFRSGYHKETTVFPGNHNNQKGTGLINLFHKSTDERFSFSFTTAFVNDDNKLTREDLTSDALTLAPIAPQLFDEDGKLYWGPSAQAPWSNPMSKIERPYQAKISNLNSNINAQFKILDQLIISNSAGFNWITSDEFTTVPLRTLNPFNSISTTTSVFANNQVKTWISEPQLRYTPQLSSSTKFDIILGATFQESIQQGDAIRAMGYTSDALLRNKLSAASYQIANADYNQYRYVAVFSRLNAIHKDKYIINLTARRDGSSRFGPDNRYGNFGAIGAAWLFSKEKIFEESFLSFGKIRMSYGTTGSDNVGNYAYLGTYSPVPYPYDGNRGIVPNRLTNTRYSWELNRKAELALETGFLKNRVLFNLAYFQNQSSNQLIQFPLPGTTGFTSVTQNMPASIQNNGLELELYTINIEHREFNWSTSFNFTLPKNKLVAYEGIENSPYANIYEVGMPLNTRKRYHFIGLNQETGLYNFQDINNDGFIRFPTDLIALKEVGQHYYGGLQNTFNYKGIILDIFFQFVKQTTGSQRRGFNISPGGFSNQPISVLERWSQPGDQTDIQRFTFFNPPVDQAYAFQQSSDGFFDDSSFIRLKNISLSYQLPNSLVNKIGLQKCLINIQSQNLATHVFNKQFVGLDPESGSSFLPPLQVLTTGIHLTF